jgi:hypothetical protein
VPEPRLGFHGSVQLGASAWLFLHSLRRQQQLRTDLAGAGHTSNLTICSEQGTSTMKRVGRMHIKELHSQEGYMQVTHMT